MKKLIVKIKNNEEVLISLDSELESVSFGSLDRGNVSDITNWGCFSNNGKINFFDKKNSFKYIVESYANCDVCIYYSSKGEEKLLATFKVDDYNYNDENKFVSLYIKDLLVDYQEQDLGEYYTFYAKNISAILADSYFDFVGFKTDQLENFRSIKINIPYIRKGKKWGTIDKICQATMTRCLCDEQGKPTIYSEYSRNDKKTIIKPKNIISILEKVEKRKTKMEDISMSVFNYKRHTLEPITNGANFNWYNPIGIVGMGSSGGYPYNIIAEGKNQSGGATITLLSGRSAMAKTTGLRIKEHFFNNWGRLYSSSNPYITVNIATSQDASKILNTTYVSKRVTLEDESLSIYTGFSASAYLSANLKEMTIVLDEDDAIERFNSTDNIVGNRVVTGGTLNWLGDFFTEDGEELLGSTEENSIILPTNELIQKDSTYTFEDGVSTSLGQYILDETNRRYGDGIDCIVMEVTPSDYICYNGSEVETNVIFERYSLVVPYVMRNGFEQPYRKNSDGTPVEFKVIGIEYYYKGFLRQRLHLQENKD